LQFSSYTIDAFYLQIVTANTKIVTKNRDKFKFESVLNGI
jgi:hypothetical protein